MILEIDIGNTRIKWRWLDPEGGVVDRGAEAYKNVDWSQIWQVMSATAIPNEIRIVNVSSPEVSERLYESCYQAWQLNPLIAKVEAQCAGVINGYDNPLRLGVDRWLVLLAAHARYGGRPCVVIDCGSAVTVDVLAGNGQHLGGYIVPGVTLMRKSLFADTAAVKVAEFGVVNASRPGVSTQQAVSHGVVLMLVGLCREVIDYLCVKLGWSKSDIWIVITGGDGELLQSALGVNAEYREDLVLDGLAYCSYKTLEK